MRTRLEIINHYIRERGYKSYLEIGVYRGINFEGVQCADKTGVDPVWPTTFKGTSDEFFKSSKQKFDLIFIDGLHEAKQVKRDIANSLRSLNPGGTILLHDCLPENELMQEVPRVTRDWTGDVWKAFVYYRRRPDLQMFVYNCDFGVGVIQRGQQEPLIINRPSYKGFAKNKALWMNVV